MEMEMQMRRESQEKQQGPQEWQSDDKYIMRGGVQIGSFITAELTDSAARAVNNHDALIEAANAALTLIAKLYDEEAIPLLMQYEVDGVRGQLQGVVTKSLRGSKK